MINQNTPYYSASFLKEENNNAKRSEKEENTEEKPVARDPWSDLLFGRPQPTSNTDEGNDEHTENDDRPRFSWF
ncbi:hypothetical protein [Alteribacillus sp. YIM 98480]|uniref:hypothetical protein n=1 Tax=Alteribacillus sp. YIM 98480 TaxID=2606599 RepID=UPI00131EA0E5|nr:hypothetical protein [Alteribacillus sp. YIM 98480]